MPIVSSEATSVALRPKRSPKWPKTIAPRGRAIMAAPKTRERGEERCRVVAGREEQDGEDEHGRRRVDVEVVELDRGADEARRDDARAGVDGGGRGLGGHEEPANARRSILGGSAVGCRATRGDASGGSALGHRVQSGMALRTGTQSTRGVQSPPLSRCSPKSAPDDGERGVEQCQDADRPEQSGGDGFAALALARAPPMPMRAPMMRRTTSFTPIFT